MIMLKCHKPSLSHKTTLPLLYPLWNINKILHSWLFAEGISLSHESKIPYSRPFNPRLNSIPQSQMRTNFKSGLSLLTWKAKNAVKSGLKLKCGLKGREYGTWNIYFSVTYFDTLAATIISLLNIFFICQDELRER